MQKLMNNEKHIWHGLFFLSTVWKELIKRNIYIWHLTKKKARWKCSNHI